MDNLLGGGLPLGAVMALGTDVGGGENGNMRCPRDNGNALTLLRCFVAEGVASGHAGLWMTPHAGGDPPGWLPRVVEESAEGNRAGGSSGRGDGDDDGGAEDEETKEDGLRIAWQYRRYLKQGKALDDSRVGRGPGGLGSGVSASGGSASSGGERTGRGKNTGGVRRLPEMCHRFDLTREMAPAAVAAARLRRASFFRPPSLATLATLPDPRTPHSDGGVYDADDADGALRRAYGECAAAVASQRGGGANAAADVCRIALEFPSSFLRRPACAASVACFLRALRGLLRGTTACALVVLPLGTLPRALVASMRHAVDAALDVETLPGAPSAMERTLPDPMLCVGLVRVRRLQFPGVTGANPLTRMDTTYALQVRGRRMAVRPLQLAPEEDDAEPRPRVSRPGERGRHAGTDRGRGPTKDTRARSTGAGLCGGGPPNKTNELDF